MEIRRQIRKRRLSKRSWWRELTACQSPERTSIVATAEGIVDGSCRTIPLRVIPLATPGASAITREWPVQETGRSGWWRRTPTKLPIEPVTSWRLFLNGQKACAIRAGPTIETQASGYATVESKLVGRVAVEPHSRLRFLSARRGKQRFALDHGTIHVLIWAPPTQLVVDTPAAKAVDLGCRYTLQIGSDDDGGLLTVESGWVAFQWRDLESFIPAGAACRAVSGRGPGTPCFLDTPEGLTEAIRQFDLTGAAGALRMALSGARRRDALTLWHLLLRTQGMQRAEVFGRFAALVTLPPEVKRAAILRGNQEAKDAAWNALDLGPTGWWREWKRQW